MKAKTKVTPIRRESRPYSAPDDPAAAAAWRARQVASEAGAYADCPLGGLSTGQDVRPLLAIVAGALARDEGAMPTCADQFVEGALVALSEDLEMLHHALRARDVDTDTASNVAWRLSERTHLISEVAARIRETAHTRANANEAE